MPNWVEGKLKIRGKPEDIKRWVEECLHCYTTNWLGDGAHTELVEGAVRFEHDPDSEEMYLYVDKSAHIEGTRRNFIEKGEYVDFCEEGKKSILVVNMKAAWNIEEQPYIEMSQKYNLDFRVYGYEMGIRPVPLCGSRRTGRATQTFGAWERIHERTPRFVCWE